MKAVFEKSISGHRIEYLYHICEYVKDKNIQNILVFGPHKFYVELRNRFNFSENKKYSFFIPIAEEDLNAISQKTKFRNGYATLSLLKKIHLSFDVSEFFILSFEFAFEVMPFFNFPVKVSGIKYHFNDNIVNPKQYSKGLKDRAKQILFSKCLASKTLKRLYLLNNIKLAESLSKNYLSSKIFILKDPVFNLKQFYNTAVSRDNDTRVKFIHLGVLTERKGTTELIQSIAKIPQAYYNKFEIIIAGMAKAPYFNQLEQAKRDIEEETGFSNLSLINKFLSNEEMHNFLSLGNFVILPYKFTEMSSGIVGHAINYGIPLIVPNSGYYKQLLTQFNIGFSMETDLQGIANAITHAIDNGYSYNFESAEEFLKINSPEVFASTIINSFND